MKKIKLTSMQLFVILLFCVSITIQTPASPTLPANGKIAFTSDRDGNSEIYLMNADGSGQTRLTNNSVRDDYPTWSPDGRTIAFVRQNGGASSINLMNADGTNIRELTTFNTASYYASGLSWSPDGTKIAFGYSGDIYAINIDGSNRVNLTNGQFTNYDPSWSADGTRIAFTRTGNYQGYAANIYTMNADGSDVREITPYRDYFDYGISPDYSPDDRQIALAVYSEDLYNFYGISLINTDGTNPQFLSISGNTYSPKWSPDGTKLVFYKTDYSENISQIWVINRDGSGLTQLTNTSPNNFHPDWQPLTPELGLIVTRSDDRNATCASGDCSLREAVNAANASATDDTINFAAGLTRITLTNEIIIRNAGTLTINGTGADVLTIDGGAGTNRIFYINEATATISGITLTGGNGTLGGAILAESGSLTLDHVHIKGNSANAGGGVYLTGAGLYRIINSTISGNRASFDCAGLINLIDGYLIMVNSTVSGNTAPSVAGGLCNYGIASLRNVTVTNNTALQDSGIYNEGTLDFGNTIVAGNNETGFSYAPEINNEGGTVSSAGYNLVGDSPGDSNSGYYSFPIYYAPTDILDTNPLLGALQNNGGTTPTHALLAGSPAIDKGINRLVSPLASVFDQRGTGFARIRDGNGDGTPTVDIGAFEAQSGAAANRQTLFDFDRDGKSDISVFRPSDGTWYLNGSQAGFSAVQFGISTDKIVPADYDNDGKTDIAVYRDGTWIILQSSNNQVRYVNFGTAEDSPRPGDFDGDGQADIAVFRPSNGYWYYVRSSDNQFCAIQFGQSGDAPMIGDYDGDGKTDVAVWRPSNGFWYILRSLDSQVQAAQFGTTGDIPINGDFNGDGKSDLAVYRPSEGNWYQLRSTEGFAAVQFGNSTDLPVPADYDGDGKTDVAVFRPSEGTWYQLRSTRGFNVVQFGANGDRPIPNAFVP